MILRLTTKDEKLFSREPDSPIHLCRIRYLGSEDRWGFAYYKHSSDRYESSFLLSGEDQGTPEEAFDTSTLFW